MSLLPQVRSGGSPRPSTLVLLTALLLGACASTPTESDEDPRPPLRLFHLPWTPGEAHRCVQTGPGPFSHHGSSTFAIDFAMAEGTLVLAARSGRVVAVKQDSDRGGWSRDYAGDANYVRILHEDGTRASYLHLRLNGAAVSRGDVVKRGQIIGYSGDTGWSAFPHLHFQVDARDPARGRWWSIPVAFLDVPGDGVPRFLGSYTSRIESDASQDGERIPPVLGR